MKKDHEHNGTVLQGPLEFGNPDQIAAVKRDRVEIARQEERTKRIKDGIVKQYRVAIELSATEYVTVWATSKEEALKIAEEEPCDPIDWEVESQYATEIKQEAKKEYFCF